MKVEYEAYYQALELPPGAAPEDVKRAYFRLLRRYSPEKDPEQFKKIRAAYEAVKDGPPVDEDAGFSKPEDEVVEELIARAERCQDWEEYGKESKALEEALELMPDDPWLLLHLARAQKADGHPQKAAKTAQKLAKLYPDCIEAHGMIAVGMYDRGWYKKALPFFRKAYEMGERDTDFLLSYAGAAHDNGENGELIRAAREVIHSVRKWTKDTVEHALAAYMLLTSIAKITFEELSAVLDEYQAFVTDHRRLFENPMAAMVPALAAFAAHEEDMPVLPLYRKVDGVFEAVERRFSDSDVAQARNDLLCKAIKSDKRFKGTSWPLLAEAMTYSVERKEIDEAVPQQDAGLCVMKEGDAARKLIDVIRADYPYFYESQREFIDRMEAGDTGELFERYKREVAKFHRKYGGSAFFNQYPEELPGFRAAVRVHDGEEPFVRKVKKVGRNDPCPCGSGKKFKRCCIGKGIYD